MIELRNVTKEFDDVTPLKDVSVTINDGDVISVIGPSGTGKSTLLRCINMLSAPTSGQIIVDGEDITEKGYDLNSVRKKMGMVFQSFNLFGHMTVLENIMQPQITLLGRSRQEAYDIAMDLLNTVGLSSKALSYPDELSGGQQQRIAIARSLLLKPSLLLLDEPFSALDAKIRQQMREELKKIQSDLGITVVFVTHDQEEAMALSHRIVVMNKGKFDQVGTPEEIYDKPATLHVAGFIGEMNFVERDGKILAVRPEDITVKLGNEGDLPALVRTIMLLGHYVVMTAEDSKGEIIKCFIDRELAEQLKPGTQVSLCLGKHTVFEKEA